MKIYTISLLCLSILLSACQQTKNISHVKSNEIKTEPINHMIDNSQNIAVALSNDSQEIFYVTRNDMVNLPKYLYEHRVPATLIVHHNCLSIKTLNEEHISTFIVSDGKEILFDDNQKIIGLINNKSKKKFLIGDRIRLSGTNTVHATSSTKPVPKECSQKLVLTGDII